jgi:hypothetical protein
MVVNGITTMALTGRTGGRYHLRMFEVAPFYFDVAQINSEVHTHWKWADIARCGALEVAH